MSRDFMATQDKNIDFTELIKKSHQTNHRDKP